MLTNVMNRRELTDVRQLMAKVFESSTVNTGRHLMCFMMIFLTYAHLKLLTTFIYLITHFQNPWTATGDRGPLGLFAPRNVGEGNKSGPDHAMTQSLEMVARAAWETRSRKSRATLKHAQV